MTDFQAARAIHIIATKDMQRNLALVAQVETDLRSAGVPSITISSILAAAFMASLTNLSREQRVRALQAHLAGVRAILEGVLGAEQTPDGPLETL